MRWRDRNVDLVEPHPPFPLALPRSRPTATPPTADDPTVRAVEFRMSVQIVGGRLPGRERHLRYLLGEHRRTLSVPVTDTRPFASAQAKPGCKTPCKRVRGEGWQLCRLGAHPARTPSRWAAPSPSAARTGSVGRSCRNPLNLSAPCRADQRCLSFVSAPLSRNPVDFFRRQAQHSPAAGLRVTGRSQHIALLS